MKKSLLTIALAVATASLIFAAPQAGAPASSSNAAPATTQKVKKHVKKTHKVKTPKATAAPAAKPATK